MQGAPHPASEALTAAFWEMKGIGAEIRSAYSATSISTNTLGWRFWTRRLVE
jgi:hypothetical protein